MNPTPPTSSDAIKDTYAILEHVRDAWQRGRPIVPIIGAGFSADSGFPILNSICRYFARVKLALEEHLLLPNSDKLPQHFLTRCQQLRALALGVEKEMKQAQPLAYVRAFGWPNRFDLTQLVARRFAGGKTSTDGAAHEAIENEIYKTFDWLARHSTTQRAAGKWDEFVGLKEGEPEADPDRAWKRWAVQGDWRRLIQFFTSYQSDFADELFAQFSASRAPSRGHRALSQLIQLMSLRRVFTFNFDDLIEKTLATDGVAYRLFGMEHGLTLPSAGAVGEELAVVKMHGSHHSILVDERLDQPLSEEYVDRFYKLVGQGAVLLVLGCSGDDRRLADLLNVSTKHEAEVCWLHFERAAPDWVRGLKAPVNNPGAFVRHLLYYLSGRFPESATSYSSHPYLPTLFGKRDPWTDHTLRYENKKGFRFCSKIDIKDSEALLHCGHLAVNSGFVPIWIDLEAVHTLAGLVGSIMDACRRVDGELAPSVMPVDDTQQEHALDLLEHALQRQRYAILIDGLGTYRSNLLMHHGHSEQTTGPTLTAFLEKLLARNIGQSIVLASTYTPQPRRSGARPECAFPALDKATGPALAWIVLATLRRTRALPTLRRLLSPMFAGAEDRADVFLRNAADQHPEYLRFLESGETWFVRDQRDAYYDKITWYSSKTQFELLDWSTSCQQLALAQCALAGLLHRKIASTYFNFEFMQSRDAHSFMEYTYHRFSNLRYFSRVIYLLTQYPSALAAARAQLKTLLDELPADFTAEGYFGAIGADLFGSAEPKEVTKHLRDARLRDLRALLASWQEWEQSVRSQIPAEQLLLWLKELTDEKMAKRLIGAYCGEECQTEEDDKPYQDLCAEQQNLLAYFKRLTVRVLVERGDLKEARERLNRDASDPQARFDWIECAVRLRDEGEGARELLDGLPKDTTGKVVLDATSEAQLRYHHLSGLQHLGGTSFIETGIDTNGVLVGVNDKQIDDAKKEAESGIDAIRGSGAQLAPALDGMIVGAGSPGGAYRPYRAVFRTLKGRCLAAELLVKPLDPTPLNADLATLRRTMREFDQAKGGLDAQHALLRGWADLHAAETTVLFVRRTFARAIKKNEDEYLGLIGAKLAVCGAQLRRAFEGLRAGRRNAIWWRHYHQVAAQYATERLLLNLCKLQTRAATGTEWAPEEGDLRRQYRNALESVAAFVDCSFDRDKAFKSPWLRRVLSEVLRGTAVALVAHEWRADNSAPLKNATELWDLVQLMFQQAKLAHPRAFGALLLTDLFPDAGWAATAYEKGPPTSMIAWCEPVVAPLTAPRAS